MTESGLGGGHPRVPREHVLRKEAALGAHRLRKALAIDGDGIDAIAKVFQLHPHFHPRTYVDFRVELTGERAARISIRDCPALEEGDVYSWFAGLGVDSHPALDAIAGAINPHARCHPIEDPKDARLAPNLSPNLPPL